MKKTIKLLAVIILTASAAQSQDKKAKIGIGPVVSMPTGTFGDINSVGLGAEITASYKILENIELFGQAGMHYFTGKKISLLGMDLGKTEAMKHFPFLAGARFTSEHIFGGVGIGYGIYEDMSGFTFSPQIGYRLNNLDVILHFTSSSISGSSLGYFGLKTAYNF